MTFSNKPVAHITPTMTDDEAEALCARLEAGEVGAVIDRTGRFPAVYFAGGREGSISPIEDLADDAAELDICASFIAASEGDLTDGEITRLWREELRERRQSWTDRYDLCRSHAPGCV